MKQTYYMSDLTENVIGAAIEVHRMLGPVYLESVYEEALFYELQLRGIPVERQKVISINYKDRLVGEGRLDLLINNTLIVELKAVNILSDIHVAQVLFLFKNNRTKDWIINKL